MIKSHFSKCIDFQMVLRDQKHIPALPDVNIEFIVGQNDLDFYKFMDENNAYQFTYIKIHYTS